MVWGLQGYYDVCIIRLETEAAMRRINAREILKARRVKMPSSFQVIRKTTPGPDGLKSEIYKALVNEPNTLKVLTNFTHSERIWGVVLSCDLQVAGLIPVATRSRDPPYHRGFGNCMVQIYNGCV